LRDYPKKKKKKKWQFEGLNFIFAFEVIAHR
jgi:hypothetical protein